MKKLYTANATATGGREGRTKSDDGVLDFKIEIPKEMGGKGGSHGRKKFRPFFMTKF